MGTKRENDEDINGRLGKGPIIAQKSPNQISSFIYFRSKSDSGQVAEFFDRPTIKANAKEDDMMKSAQRHEDMREKQGCISTCS
jgi:hypothetical protein